MTPQEKLDIVGSIISRLPPPNLSAFSFLLSYLVKVQQHSDVNQMTSRNLSIVFGPILLKTKDLDPAAILTHNELCCQIIEYIIDNWNTIVPKYLM